MTSVETSVFRQDRLVLNVCGGVRICVPASLEEITPYVLLEQEDWFEDEIRFVRRWLRRGMRALDVGANYGAYTAAMALAVGNEGRVWAFEPTPRTADFLERTLALNDHAHVSLSRAAISDCAGTVRFALSGQPELNAVLAAGQSAQETINVPAVTLSEMAQRHDWGEVDFVKLDVEGHEVAAITGGARFFKESSPLVMLEIKAGERVDLQPFTALADMGYGCYALLPGPLVLAPFDEAEPVDGYQLNLFACKRDRAERLAAEGFLVDERRQALGAAPKDAWARYAASASYAGAFAARWRPKAGLFSAPEKKTYERGLAAYAQSRDAAQSPARRIAWLHEAMSCVEEAASANDDPAWKMSYARLAWELGWRENAVQALEQVAERLAEAAEAVLAEPFLAPSARYERLAAGENAGAWLRCAVLEQLEKLRVYSSMFGGTSSLAVLQPIVDLPLRSPEVDRRRQLVRMAAGLQAGPKPAPLLCIRSAENLNPEFWCGSES